MKTIMQNIKYQVVNGIKQYDLKEILTMLAPPAYTPNGTVDDIFIKRRQRKDVLDACSQYITYQELTGIISNYTAAFIKENDIDAVLDLLYSMGYQERLD